MLLIPIAITSALAAILSFAALAAFLFIHWRDVPDDGLIGEDMETMGLVPAVPTGDSRGPSKGRATWKQR